MTVSDRIHEYVQRLPERLLSEVLNFIEHLLAKADREDSTQNEREWTNISLSLAMHGMEDEETPEYSVSDLTESF